MKSIVWTVLILVTVAFCGCTNSPQEKRAKILKSARIKYKHYCATDEQRRCMAEVAVKCAEAANPKSDEEPEDWLPKCKNIAEEGCCPLTKGVSYKDVHGFEYNWLPWSEVPEEHKKALEDEHRLS
jgi:hypothetical protein